MPETIVVSLLSDDDHEFDLLCWTVNMAARPGDRVVALKRRDYGGDALQKFIAGYNYRPEAIDARFKPLQDLCDLKQVHLEMKAASTEVAAKILIDEVSSIKATMLVVSVSGNHLMRHAQRRGTFLCRQVPAGCSVVVVKDYKVLFYKENNFRATLLKTGSAADAAVQAVETLPTSVSESKTVCDTSLMTPCNTAWGEGNEMYSPKRVLDSSDAFYDSDDSPSNDRTGLIRSSSRKSVVSSSWNGDGDALFMKQSNGCLGIWRRGTPVYRLHSFPATHLSKRAFISSHCKSFGVSFKSCMTSLWSVRPLKRSNTSTQFILSQKPWKVFKYEEVLKATGFFAPGSLVGKGGHSEVYKGVLPGGRHVAVKRLIPGFSEEQKTIEFLTEIGMICQISHPNITPLVGFCIEKGLYLVFPYMQNGSLDSWLHGGRTPSLKWSVRYKIAVGTAHGLNYLHCDCQRRIIHRDIKASNILLGLDFEPQISDFGLAKWLPDQCSQHISTPVEGTFGYLAPEYVMHGIVDEKTDVFSFGVLLLELITGCKPIGGLQSSLVMWARPFLETMNVEKLVDPKLHSAYDQQEMQCMMMAAALCVQSSPQCRPTMRQVLQLLSDDISSDGADSLSVFSSQSLCLQDPIFDNDYSSINYHNDLRRHREIALQF